MSLPAVFTTHTARAVECIVWTGAVNTKGYGCLFLDGRSQLSHRVAYEEAKGSIPDDFTIDHLCRVRNCVNPEHLEAVSNAENIRRARQHLSAGSTCRRGHDVNSVGIYTRPNGSTECRACRQGYRSSGVSSPNPQLAASPAA